MNPRPPSRMPPLAPGRYLLFCVLAGPVTAATTVIESWSSGFTNGGLIPDGNPAGWSDTRIFTGITETHITDVNVRLSILGGWIGDLYAYLQHENGIAILLNRPGRTDTNLFGYSDAEMEVIFEDLGINGDSHVNFTGSAILSGASWEPDGRATDPSGALDTDARTNFLNSFTGMNPNGAWTLFVADLSHDGLPPAIVIEWGLEITAIPEPSPALLIVIALSWAMLNRSSAPPRPSSTEPGPTAT